MKGIFHYNDGVERRSAQKIKSELSWYISPRTSPPHHSISLRAFSNQMRDQRQDTRHQSYIYSDCVHWRGRHNHALVVWIMLSTPELWQKPRFHLAKKELDIFPSRHRLWKKKWQLWQEKLAEKCRLLIEFSLQHVKSLKGNLPVWWSIYASLQRIAK